MIIGLGSDLIDITRIERLLAKYGSAFEQRVFTLGERERAQRCQVDSGRNSRAAIYAKRFAAKEACGKALGTGLGSIGWKDIEVINNESGAPTLKLHGPAEALLKEKAGLAAPHIHVSLSDEYPYAQAVVIISV